MAPALAAEDSQGRGKTAGGTRRHLIDPCGGSECNGNYSTCRLPTVQKPALLTSTEAECPPPARRRGEVACATILEIQCHLCVIQDFDPPRVDRGVRGVFVMPVPPLVGRSLRIALRRILPLLLASERGYF